MIIRDIKEYKGYFVGKMNSTLFDVDIDVMMKINDYAYAERCAEYFNNMSNELIDELKLYTLRYCEDFRQFFDEQSPDVPAGVTERDIFNYVSPRVVLIEAPKNSDEIGFSVEFGCQWEREHGMEWVIRGGKVLYVGDFSNIGTWRDYNVYLKHCMNYVFNERCMD